MVKLPSKKYSFSANIWQRFRMGNLSVAALAVIGLLIFICIFADFIANDQPIYAKYKGQTFFPALSSVFNPSKVDTISLRNGETEVLQFDITNWKELKLDRVIWPLIAYSPKKPDPYNRDYVGPFDEQVYKNPDGEIVPIPFKFRHYLGTNQIGIDVAAAVIHGARTSLFIGLVSAGIAGIAGIILGSLAGYFGDNKFKMSLIRLLFAIMGIFTGFFYGFIVRSYILQEAANASFLTFLFQMLISLVIFGVAIRVFLFIGSLFNKIPFLRISIYIPIDNLISRTIEIFQSLPKLLLIITIAALFRQKSLLIVMAIIGLTYWTGIARLTRAEFLRTTRLDYIAAAEALGFSRLRTIFKHALPNSLTPVFVAFTFAIANAILIESGLSFLGIGVPDDQITWGSLLSAGRQRFDAWWLILFPGLAIFITVLAYNIIGEALRDAIDPKLRK